MTLPPPPYRVTRYGHHSYCPVCMRYFQSSPYLLKTFLPHTGAVWLSNVIMHYRHAHRRYDNDIKFIEYHYGISPAEQKRTINEQAKRQILRKCYPYMVSHGIGIDSLLKLNVNSEQTINLYEKFYNTKVPEVELEKYLRK